MLGWRTYVAAPKTPKEQCDLFWHDCVVTSEKLTSLQPYQRANHFPAMSGVTKKASLAESLYKMRQHFWQDYSFFPKTWILP